MSEGHSKFISNSNNSYKGGGEAATHSFTVSKNAIHVLMCLYPSKHSSNFLLARLRKDRTSGHLFDTSMIYEIGHFQQLCPCKPRTSIASCSKDKTPQQGSNFRR